MALLSEKKYEEAVAPLETAVKLEPENPAGHYNLATAYARTGRKEAAEREFALQQQTAQHDNPQGGTSPRDPFRAKQPWVFAPGLPSDTRRYRWIRGRRAALRGSAREFFVPVRGSACRNQPDHLGPHCDRCAFAGPRPVCPGSREVGILPAIASGLDRTGSSGSMTLPCKVRYPVLRSWSECRF